VVSQASITLPWGKEPAIHFLGVRGVPRACLDAEGEEKESLPLQKIEPRSSNTVAYSLIGTYQLLLLESVNRIGQSIYNLFTS